MPFFIGVLFLFLLWFLLLLLFALSLVWLFRVLVPAVLPPCLPAVLFCLRWLGFPLRSVLAVLRALTASCVLPFRPLRFSRFLRFWLVGVCVVLRLLVARLLWFRGALRRAVCSWRFRLVLVRLRLLRPLPFRVAVRGRGVLLPWRLVWVARCLWLCRRVRFLLRLLWLRASALWALRPAVVRCGCPFLRPFSFLCFSPPVGGLLDF